MTRTECEQDLVPRNGDWQYEGCKNASQGNQRVGAIIFRIKAKIYIVAWK